MIDWNHPIFIESRMASTTGGNNMETARIYPLNRNQLVRSIAASAPTTPPKPKLLNQVRQAIRTRHYSIRTEKAYVHWIKRFIFFHDKRHPNEMGESEIAQFLSSLATDRHVSASTQNQAFLGVIQHNRT